MECLECKTELTQTEGKRAKKFCNSTCRSNYWQKEQTKKKKESLMKVVKTETFLTPNSTITNLSNGTTIENKTNKVQEVEPEMPSWKKKLLEYQSQQKNKK